MPLITLCLALLGSVAVANGQATTMAEALTGCGSTKGCFMDPSGCSAASCDYVVTYNGTADYVDFEMSVRIPVGLGSSFYAAVGLSRDMLMGDDSVVDCIHSGSSTTVQLSWNPDKSNNPLTDATTGLSQGAGTFAGGVYTCSFRRDNTRSDMNMYYDTSPANEYFLLVARGTASSATAKSYHMPTNRVFASSAATLSSTDSVGAGADTDALVRAHACLMIVAWAMFAGFGIINARFMKEGWPGKKDCMDVPLWFTFHRGGMICAFVITVVAFILIFVDVKGWSNLASESPGILRAHPILGVVVTGLAVANPFMALFRCDKNAPNRWIFNWFHRMVGQIAFVLAVVNIFLGIELSISSSFSSRWMLYVMIAYAALHIITELLLLLLSCCCGNRNNKDSAMEMRAPGESGSQPPPKSSCSANEIIVTIYGVVTLGLVLAVVIGMAIA